MEYNKPVTTTWGDKKMRNNATFRARNRIFKAKLSANLQDHNIIKSQVATRRVAAAENAAKARLDAVRSTRTSLGQILVNSKARTAATAPPRRTARHRTAIENARAATAVEGQIEAAAVPPRRTARYRAVIENARAARAARAARVARVANAAIVNQYTGVHNNSPLPPVILSTPLKRTHFYTYNNPPPTGVTHRLIAGPRKHTYSIYNNRPII